MARFQSVGRRAVEAEGGVMPEPVSQLLTLMDLATLLRLSPHTIRAMVRRGQLRPIRICRRLLFDPESVKRLLEDAK